MRSRGYYKKQTRYDRSIRRKPCEGKRVHQDPQLILDALENNRMFDDQLRKWKLEDGIHWLLGFSSYVKEKESTFTPAFKDEYIFRRGDIVLVDFFGHFGTELTYEHPAIVLYDAFDGVIIAPISSSCYNDGISTHVSLTRGIGDLGNVKNDCGIKLEQSRFISKRRILNKFNRVTNTDKLNEIDDVLMTILTPYSYGSMKQEKELLLEQNKLLLTQFTEKNKEVESKEKEIEALRHKIQLLEQKVSDEDQEENVS